MRFNPDKKDFCILEVVNKIFFEMKYSLQMSIFRTKNFVGSITGHKKGSFSKFYVSDDQIQTFFRPTRITNKDVFCHTICL